MIVPAKAERQRTPPGGCGSDLDYAGDDQPGGDGGAFRHGYPGRGRCNRGSVILDIIPGFPTPKKANDKVRSVL